MAMLVATAFSGSAEARRHHIWYSWGGWGWGPPVHAANDFVANKMNRQVLGIIGYNGALGLDQATLGMKY